MRTSVILFVGCLSFLLSACAKQETLTPKLWSVPTGGVFSSALEGNLMVGYLEKLDDQVAAVDIEKRKLIWRSAVGEGNSFSRGFAIDEKAVYVFLRNKGLYVYSREGKVLKQLVPPKKAGEEVGRASADLGLLGSQLYIPNERRLYAYDVSNPGEPTLLWQRTLPSPIRSLAVAPDGVYVGGVSLSPKANILKLSPADGRDLWQGDLQGFGQGVPLTQALTVAGERVISYSIELRGALQAFDQETGSRLWATPLESCSDGAGFADNLEIGDGKVFVSPRAGSCLFAVDLATGQEAWTVESAVGPDGAISIGGKPLYHNGVVYTSVERLWAVDARTGDVLSFASSPAYNTTITKIHYADDQILVWGDELTAYKPVR